MSGRTRTIGFGLSVGVLAVSLGAQVAAAEDGAIVAWGRNDYGQCNVPSPNTGFVTVARGMHHNLGLKSDGSIVAWGWNDYGQCNVPPPNDGFVAVAGGGCHSLGLKAYTGDLNCDGHVNFGDINPFVLILADPVAWQGVYPGSPLLNGDINGDSLVNFGDINPFVQLLAGG
jgi:hypothetical protein